MTSSQEPDAAPAVVRVHGPATPEDVAAVLAVLAAAGGPASAEPEEGSSWASRRTLLRGRHDPGPSAWSTTYRG